MHLKNLLLSFIIFLFISSMTYACTGIMLKNIDRSIVHGRTLEFGIAVDTSIAVIPRGYYFTGQIPSGVGMKYSAKYAAVGAIAFKDIKILDGLNEQGLAIGTFYFPTFASYATIKPDNKNKALSPIDFPNWILTQFATTAEVKKALENNSVVIAPTIIPSWGTGASPPFHYIVYDKTGASIVIEPINGKLIVSDNPLGVFTNSPTFDWHMINLRNYISLNPRNVPQVTIDGTIFKQLGQGNGMLGLPGDFSPPSRFIRAAVFSATAIPSKNVDEGILQVFHILNNFDIPVGVAREESNGIIHTDYTIVTTARDPQGLRYYYKTYDDQSIRMVDLKQFDMNAKNVKILNINTKQLIINMSDKLR